MSQSAQSKIPRQIVQKPNTKPAINSNIFTNKTINRWRRETDDQNQTEGRSSPD